MGSTLSSLMMPGGLPFLSCHQALQPSGHMYVQLSSVISPNSKAFPNPPSIPEEKYKN